MNKCSAASPACADGGYAQCGQKISLREQKRDDKKRPGHVKTYSQEPRERPFSVVYPSNGAPCSHQRRWSADFCKCGISSVITVRKNKREPQPPQRSASLLQPNTASNLTFKRYSCPPIGVFRSPSHPSSSSSSSTSSCSSPPPVQTGVIMGHDPLGWKLHPKSSSTSPRAHSKRLSLQISLPIIFPDPKSSPASDSQSDNTPNPKPSPNIKPPLKPKRFHHRHHSDSSAFLRSLATPMPVVTLEQLCGVHLRPLTLSDESDDVFSGGNEEKVKVTPRPRKMPPPVPEKTLMARQIAQLIAHSRQSCETEKEDIYTNVIKPKPKHSHQAEDHSSLHETKTAGLCVDTSCDRERPTPRFPG